MEAAPRLPMISFELKTSTENVSFGPKLKQYIAGFYHEDPESYNTEIHNLETLRAAAVRPSVDVTGCQMLKKYYCQLNFLKSRFPMEKGQSTAVTFSWKDVYAGLVCSVSDIEFELSSILYNIGALHTQLGATDSRSSSEGMKMSCTHFQCAAWAFQHLKEKFSQFVSLSLAPEVVHFMYQLSLAHAQECILEKSMMDNRKSTIIAKVAVQVVDYFNQAMSVLMAGSDEGSMGEIIGTRVFKDWNRYLKFKVAYHSCISLLYQGQQAEEQQKMGERVAFYQAASEQLEDARRIAKGNMGQQQHDIDEALAFTQDVVEGKKKAAKNENEFIYHEVVPERDALQQTNGASLVKGIPFSVSDLDVSGPDLFQRLVPMEAHEASSVYSEQKAEMLRQIGALVDAKDAELAEFMSSLQFDCVLQWRQAVGVPQDVVDRAAAICAKPQATQALVEAMGRLSNTCHEVESVLGEIQEVIKEEESKEQEYQKLMGTRPPSIVSTDLSREAGKYHEAHSKANESNQTLHRAMTMHMANLKILAQPISELKKAIPSAQLGDPNVDATVITELETLVSKVEEMRAQRATLVTNLREAICADDITSLLVTRSPNVTLDQLFQKELGKHKHQAALIEQNLAAQENILSALTDSYAKFAQTRRYIMELLKRRESTVTALIASYDAYDDLLAKASKGIEFYQKLEANVSKLQQRVKSACRVNDEEREQMLAKSVPTTSDSSVPKLKHYLASMRASQKDSGQWLPAVRPAPLGSEGTNDTRLQYDSTTAQLPQQAASQPQQQQPTVSASSYAYPDHYYYSYNTPVTDTALQQPQQQVFSTQYTPQIQANYQTPASYYYSTTQPSPYYTQPETTQVQPQTGYQVSSSYVSNIEVKPSPPPQPAAPVYYVQPDPKANYSVPVSFPDPNTSQYYQTTTSTYYSQPDTNTLPSQPQQNLQITSTYSPSVDTKAPSQLNQDYQTPPGFDNYQEANYQYVSDNQSYPAMYQVTSEAYPQYQTPTIDYQNQYQYYQYYPNYEQPQVPTTTAPASLPSSDSSTNLNNYYTMPYGYQTIGINSMTMMHANNGADTTSKSTVSVSSNVDLLTGLDFSGGQAPLQPQVNIPVTTSAQKTEVTTVVTTTPASTIAATASEVKQEKSEKPEESIVQDPLADPEALNAFAQEVEKLEKFVDGLTTKTLNGPTTLDMKWKEIQEQQERDGQTCSISVARCYPMKNRFPDILPYDQSRVELPSTKDDYINASHIKGVSAHSPPFIVTQAPLKSTVDDFWTMVFEQQIEVIVCLMTDAEVQQEGCYWPVGKGEDFSLGKYRLILQSVNGKEHWVERILSLTDGNKNMVIVHLQFTGWPGSGLFPTKVTPLLAVASATLACHHQQRARGKPILVHCLPGVGHSGVLCTLIAAMCDPLQMLDVSAAAIRMSRYRKNILRDREHLKFAYEAVLYHAKDLLAGKQLQSKLQNVAISASSDELSSRRSSTASESSVDVKQRKKFTPESFGALKEQGGIAPSNDTHDPLSTLDPLWTIRK